MLRVPPSIVETGGPPLAGLGHGVRGESWPAWGVTLDARARPPPGRASSRFPGVSMRQFRVGLTITLAAYGVAILASPATWSLIDNINLPVHEAGHLLCGPLGDTLELLGGTLLQLLLPLAFAAYFTAQRDEHAASIAIWWVGQNFVNISTYMADALPMDLPLVGGGEHDWNLLFSQWDLLSHSLQYAQLARGFGFLVMLIATVWGLFEALEGKTRLPPTRARFNYVRRR